MPRRSGRRADQLRPVEIIRGYTSLPAGSVLIKTGRTHVLCTASWDERVPRWKETVGGGWVTAEYDMLPGASSERKARNRLRIDGRTQEIQRLIGRALRAVIDVDKLGERTLILDCDVLQADGGTRAASITGAYVAACDAVQVALDAGLLTDSPIRGQVAAVSVGVVDGRLLLDLDAEEDAAAQADLNVAMTAQGQFVEVQGTAEGAPFTRQQLDRMLTLAGRGIRQLLAAQKRALKRRLRR